MPDDELKRGRECSTDQMPAEPRDNRLVLRDLIDGRNDNKVSASNA